jgi:hypothetical protein
VLGPQNPDSVYACYADVWLSPDRGSTWKNLSNGASGASKQCVQVAVAPSDPRVIYVAKDAEWDAMHMIDHGDPRTPFLEGGGVFRSSDGGQTWQLISGELPLAKAGLTNLAVSTTDARKAWVTFSGNSSGVKVFATDDGGMSWKNVSPGLPNLPAMRSRPNAATRTASMSAWTAASFIATTAWTAGCPLRTGCRMWWSSRC